ncbi:DUF2007 domain-containing protein [Dyadobacter sp. CY326]|uniref:putative signal transducing protein n=1 Tax=Dyadobacter sp. CY326 TaxID=2907300 RepID=UPI001F2EA656|nr:DUF2007 domain-containing protein [Dyadobacter sp. CY326]MCE7066430.1 DUF2007 domain-containing protein [Dyadobacter sp. CY326]
MAENWAKAFQSGQIIRAEIAREILEQNGIAAVIIDKKDSNYPVFGAYEVHVLASDLSKAQTIITNESALKESE